MIHVMCVTFHSLNGGTLVIWVHTSSSLSSGMYGSWQYDDNNGLSSTLEKLDKGLPDKFSVSFLAAHREMLECEIHSSTVFTHVSTLYINRDGISVEIWHTSDRTTWLFGFIINLNESNIFNGLIILYRQ